MTNIPGCNRCLRGFHTRAYTFSPCAPHSSTLQKKFQSVSPSPPLPMPRPRLTDAVTTVAPVPVDGPPRPLPLIARHPANTTVPAPARLRISPDVDSTIAPATLGCHRPSPGRLAWLSTPCQPPTPPTDPPPPLLDATTTFNFRQG
jgi:hypothetical protein